jgi:hypothetical protein
MILRPLPHPTSPARPSDVDPSEPGCQRRHSARQVGVTSLEAAMASRLQGTLGNGRHVPGQSMTSGGIPPWAKGKTRIAT